MDFINNDIYNQSGVIPYRIDRHGLKLLIITSRNGKHWIFPKGIIENEMTPQDSALSEAYEEAGVRGKVHTKPIGKFKYEKWGGICTVQIFLLKVEHIYDSWPEDNFRKRKWVTPVEAKSLVSPAKLRKLLNRIPDHLQ